MEPYPNSQQPPAAGIGCFLKGCVALLVLAFFVAAGFGYGVYRLARFQKAFFSAQPAAIRSFRGSDAEYTALQQRLQTFSQTYEQGGAASLDLTSDDLNMLSARDASSGAKGDASRVYYLIAADKFVAEMSIPVNSDPKNGPAQHYYFNARLGLGVTVQEGQATLTPSSIETLDGQQVPGWLLKRLNQTDVAKQLNGLLNDSLKEDPKLKVILGRVRELRVSGGQVHIVTAESAPPAPQPPVAPAG